MKLKQILPVVAILVFCLTGCKREPAKFNTTIVAVDTVQSTVTATGYVQPVDKVAVGTQVSGVIEKIYADFNTQVKKGQLLAELDKSTLIERVTQAEANYTSAMSEQTFSQQNYDRIKQLYDVKAATQASYEQAVNALAQSLTNVSNAKANLHQAKVNLSYAEIYSPIDGVVLNRAVDQGQTVAASFSTPTLFTIAKDLTNMQVEANVDEADISKVKLGQSVTFTVDSYSDDVFDGTVNQIRIQSVVTNNVVTYTVIISAPNPDQKLFPGMTASITIVTENVEGLAVPQEAMYFIPTAEMLHGETLPEDAGDAVWVKIGDKLEHRPIKMGASDGINQIITEGISAGDTVILSVFENVEKPKDRSNPLIPKDPKKKK